MSDSANGVFKTLAETVKSRTSGDGTSVYHFAGFGDEHTDERWCLAKTQKQADREIAADLGITTTKMKQDDILVALANALENKEEE